MKTSTTLVATTITMLLLALALPAGAADYIIAGDVNDDGRITMVDVVLALQMAAGSIAPDLKRADVNQDGTVDAHDALMIFVMAQTTQVSVDAPEIVSGAFDVTIDIYNATDLDSGQFELTFNSTVVNVTGVSSGEIDGTTILVESWNFTNADTVCVLFNLPEVTGVTGDGQIATISFETTGAPGDTGVLELSSGLLVDVGSNETPALWFGCEVAIGVPVAVNAPGVVSDAFTATVDVESITDMNSGQFDLTFDSAVVNVTNVTAGEISGTEIPITLWRFMDADTIRVLFKLSGVDGMSGTGSVATIEFAVTGSQGNASVLEIFDGVLSDTEADEIPATWTDADVAIGVRITVNAPETVSDAFTATVDVEDVLEMNGGQFDLTFDPAVVNVTDVSPGEIGGTEIPLVDWRLMDADTIRVLFKLSGVDGVSGTGSLAAISFDVTGSSGDTSVLDIADGTLSDTEADEIPAIWIDGEVTA